jgi:CHAD domain-containing protein
LIESLDRPPVARSRLRAKDVVPSLVRRRWIRLSRRVDRLGKDPKDRKLHRVRIDAKRCRYAAELAAPVIGKDASRLASALAEVQTTLGELQDAAVLEGWLTRTAAELPSKQAAVGNALIEQQRQVARSARNAWDDNWHVIVDRGLATWLERP